MRTIRISISVAYEGDGMRRGDNIRTASIAAYFVSPDDAATYNTGLTAKEVQIRAAGGIDQWCEDCSLADEGIEPIWAHTWKQGLREMRPVIEDGTPPNDWVCIGQGASPSVKYVL